MTNFAPRTALACLSLLLAACNTLPPYTPAPGERTVRAHFVGSGSPSICFDGKAYELPLQETRGRYHAELPAGRRVQVATYQAYQGYQVVSSCNAALSLVPQAGKPIVINSGLAGGKCYIEAVREDSGTPTGLAPDPTVRPPRC